jgi:uncharacterized membrane protein YidH (DUF202 family)
VTTQRRGQVTLFDPGVQLERTHLAWTRTALGFFANAALVLRLARDTYPALAGYVIASMLGMIGVIVWWHGRHTYPRRATRLQDGEPCVPAHATLILARATATVAVAAALLALTTLV